MGDRQYVQAVQHELIKIVVSLLFFPFLRVGLMAGAGLMQESVGGCTAFDQHLFFGSGSP